MWLPLRRFRDSSVPKLHNLARASARGIRVPKTVWSAAREAPPETPKGFDFPLIVRSGSPTEDTHETSNAGQLLSLVVRDRAQFAESVARVVDALPKDKSTPLGVVFVQPLVLAKEAGIAFSDGFYFEKTSARGSNEALTSGKDRGVVTRGHYHRGDPWCEWLGHVYTSFSDDIERIDIEFAEDDAGFILLQARPALFPITRSETLSLANHKEILGDPPSPWIVSVLIESGRDVLTFFAEIDPAVRAWDEAYAIELGERAWMNFSFFFRLMDRWGLPRTFVTQGVGGEGGGPSDHALLPWAFFKNVWTLSRLQFQSLQTVLNAGAALAALDQTIEKAASLHDVYTSNIAAMSLAIRTNFAIGGVLSGVSRVRNALGIEGTARVVTEEMMVRYQAIGTLKKQEQRAQALDQWLREYGHRGPLESDPARPRFAELRDLLWNDLEAAYTSQFGADGPNVAAHRRGAPPSSLSLVRPGVDDDGSVFFWIDKRREWFRDELMKRWRVLRSKALSQGEALVKAGRLESASDVFWLRGGEVLELTADLAFDARSAVNSAKARREAVSGSKLPLTASRHEIVEALGAARASARGPQRLLPGIALSQAVVEGTALCVHDLTDLLADAGASGGIRPDSVLVVGALEPSWAVVFPRVRGVIAEIGGELSHASILLREARKPAIVNCKDVMVHVKTGDRVRIDGARGVVEIIERFGSLPAIQSDG
ncbi:MAG: hypothetical protein IPK82_37580 [Polyangiaceae bacterium]|nr:hypothetical protein [Polyangiaceae bacterium]